MANPTKPPSPRHMARRLAIQALYAFSVSGNSLEEEAVHTLSVQQEDNGPYDIEYFKAVIEGMRQVEAFDALMTPFLSRRLEQVSPVELAVLRLGVWELQERLDIPFRVVINEGIVLSKLFGAQDSHKFINSVLDQAAKRLRAIE